MTVKELKEIINKVPENTKIEIEGTKLVDDSYFWYNGGHLKIKEVQSFGSSILLLVPDY